jgi:hypothetical protein
MRKEPATRLKRTYYYNLIKKEAEANVSFNIVENNRIYRNSDSHDYRKGVFERSINYA